MHYYALQKPESHTSDGPLEKGFGKSLEEVEGGMDVRIGQKESRVDDRIRFFDHEGKRILLVDFSNCKASEVEEISRKVPDYVTTQPRGSVLILTNFSGASFDKDALRSMKESAVFDKPFVKKSALIGTETFPRQLYEDIKSFSRRELPIFTDRDEALAWLVAN